MISQNFEAALDNKDSRGADDFVLRQPCSLHKVVVTDWDPYPTTPGTFDLVIYLDGGGQPGAILRRFAHRDYSRSEHTFSVTLPKTVLPSGIYWISVRANENSSDGYWQWAVTWDQDQNLPVWRNPGGGWGTQCPTWRTLFACGFDSEEGGYGFAFTIG